MDVGSTPITSTTVAIQYGGRPKVPRVGRYPCFGNRQFAKMKTTHTGVYGFDSIGVWVRRTANA